MKRNPLRPEPSENSTRLSAEGYSTKALKTLFLRHHLGLGSRLLIIGDADPGLLGIAETLGITAQQCAVTDFPEHTASANSTFDVILIRELSSIPTDLRNDIVTATLHRLVQQLGESGHIVLLPRPGSALAAHRTSCFVDFLSTQPGRIRVHSNHSWLQNLRFWWTGQQVQDVMVTLHFGRYEGDSLDFPSRCSSDTPCCPAAAESASLRRAA